MKELLKKIGIDIPGYYSDSNTYVVELDDSNEYSKAFTKLDNTDLVDEMSDSSVSNAYVSNVMYINDYYSINIIADFESETYKIIVHKL
jgi:hypothetical protein